MNPLTSHHSLSKCGLEAVFDLQAQECEGLPSRPHRTRKPPLPVWPRLCPGARRPWILGYAETNTLKQVYRFPPSPPLHENRVDQKYNLPCADVECVQPHPG